jgi:hypothetical protein
VTDPTVKSKPNQMSNLKNVAIPPAIRSLRFNPALRVEAVFAEWNLSQPSGRPRDVADIDKLANNLA